MKKTALTLLALSILSAPALAQSQPSITIYAAIGYDQKVVDAFNKANGTQVKLVDLSTGPLLARVQAEKQNTQWDVVWFDGAEAMRDLANQGLLLRGWQPKVNWNALARQVIPADHAYIPAGVSLAGVFLVNAKAVPENQTPQSWADLQKPEWQGKVGMPNPAISGPTYPLMTGIMADAGGIDAGKKVLSNMKKNGMQVFDTGGPLIKQLLAGTISVAATQSTRGIDAQVKKQPVRVVYPKSMTLLPSNFGLSAHSSPEKQAVAKKFIEFFLSPAGQKVALESGDSDSYFYPLVQGARAHALLPELSTLPFRKVDPLIWGPREAALNTWFAQNVAH